MLGSAMSKHPRLTNCEIFFNEFQPIHVITIRQRHGQTDRRTDRRLAVAIGD